MKRNQTLNYSLSINDPWCTLQRVNRVEEIDSPRWQPAPK